MSKIKVGVFSPNDPRPWVRRENIDLLLQHESSLINALQNEGIEVIRGGDGFEKMDQIAWNTSLVKKHIKQIAQECPSTLILNQGSWTFPFDSVDAVTYFMNETDDIARIIIFSYKDTQVPGLVAGMAIGGALKRISIPFTQCYGVIDKDPSVLKNIIQVINFHKAQANSVTTVLNTIKELHVQKYLAIGGMSLRMPTTTADIDQWKKIFGISYEAIDQSELVVRTHKMVKWSGKPGETDYEIMDSRVQNALTYLQSHGMFDFSREKLTSYNKFVYQLTLYYAAVDVCDDFGITFAGIKCQDELSSRECTACLVTAFLGNDIGPDGLPKRIIPIACENDMDSALTQLILYLLTGQPAGFGDFRDIDQQVLTIQNCGQHPPHFFGGPEEDSVNKMDAVEYMGQEIFYFAGGSSVRGRTPGGYTMTIARLARENLKYTLIGTVIHTINVAPEDHKNYNFSWPLIRGKIPISNETLINMWPCNHLAFTFGDVTPQLVELAHRLNIGYRIFDAHGKEYFKPT